MLELHPCGQEPFGQHAGDAPAEGEDHLHGRLDSAAGRPVPRPRPTPNVPDIEQGLKKVIAMDWDKLIPGHPGPGGRQTGTKDDARNAPSPICRTCRPQMKRAIERGQELRRRPEGHQAAQIREAGTSYGPFLPMEHRALLRLHQPGNLERRFQQHRRKRLVTKARLHCNLICLTLFRVGGGHRHKETETARS